MSDQTCPLCKQQHNYIELKNSSKGVQYYEIFCQDSFGGVRITSSVVKRIKNNDEQRKKLLHLLNEKYTKDLVNSSNDCRITSGDYAKRKDVFLEKAFFIVENKAEYLQVDCDHPIVFDDLCNI